MAGTTRPCAARKARHDGWTRERRHRFLALLARGLDVRRAVAAVGLSREGAYKLRRRDPAFALAWDDVVRSARAAADEAWLAMLPERLRRAMAELPGGCELRGGGISAQDSVRNVRRV